MNAQPTNDKAKILVVYHTGSGKTAKIAELVAQGVLSVAQDDFTELRLKDISEATAEDFVWAEGIACGSPTHLGAVSYQMKEWLENIGEQVWGKVDGKIAIPFTSVGSIGGGGEITLLNLHAILQNFGFLTFGTTGWSGPKYSYHYGATIAGEPREEQEKQASIKTGAMLAKWVHRFYHHREVGV